MDNIDDRLASFRSTFFHEIGHVVGYCLANNYEETYLGKVKIFEIGLKNNFVTPFESFYHVEDNILEDMARIKTATEKIKRTIAWFVEVISGCTFQALVEERDFKTCFGFGIKPNGRYYNGHIDFSNLATVRNVGCFKWEFEQLYKIQQEYSDIILKDNLILKINGLVNDLSDKVRAEKHHQLQLSGNGLEILVNELNSCISEELLKNYKTLIDKYFVYYNNEACI